MIPDWQENWTDYEAFASTLEAPFAGRYTTHRFDYIHPIRLQANVPKRLRRTYPVSIAYTEWGTSDAPLVVCLSGVVHCAHRFHFLASGLSLDHRVICLDWVGRGRSGWLADKSEYGLETCVEQLRQFLLHVGARKTTIVGSSMGGIVAMILASRHRHLVGQLILNDTGPYMPAKRRRRRSETLARHYVFRTPAEMIRKAGVSQCNDGPISEEVRLYSTHNQTQWSASDNGRVYRHDPRAMMAYREEARQNLNIWDCWRKLRQRILVMHGLESDALLAPTLRRMTQRPDVTVAHIPDTGHTPVLDNPDHIHLMRTWLNDDPDVPTLGREMSIRRRPV